MQAQPNHSTKSIKLHINSGRGKQTPKETAARYWHQLNNLYEQAKRQHNHKVMHAVIQLMDRRGGIM